MTKREALFLFGPTVAMLSVWAIVLWLSQLFTPEGAAIAGVVALVILVGLMWGESDELHDPIG